MGRSAAGKGVARCQEAFSRLRQFSDLTFIGVELEPAHEDFAAAAEKLAEGDKRGAVAAISGALASAATGSLILGGVTRGAIKLLAKAIVDGADARIEAAGLEVDGERSRSQKFQHLLRDSVAPFFAEQLAKTADLSEQSQEQFLQLATLIRRAMEGTERGLRSELTRLASLVEGLSATSRYDAGAPFIWGTNSNVLLPRLRETKGMNGYVERRLGVRDDSPAGEQGPSQSSRSGWHEHVRQVPRANRVHPEREVLERIANGVDRRELWFLLGEPGSGKSTLVAHWTQRCLAGLPDAAVGLQLVPVRVRFRDLKGVSFRAKELAETLWAHALQGDHSRRWPWLTAEHRFRFVPLWLLDGWDEASVEYVDERFLSALVGVPGVKLLTCRTAAFESFSVRTALPRYSRARCWYTLEQLSREEQQRFLELHMHDRSQAAVLHRRLQAHEPLRFIAGNPQILKLVASLAHDDRLAEFPASRASFYARAVRHAWYTKVSPSERTADGEHLIDSVLTQLAGSMGLRTIEATPAQLSAALGTTKVSTKKREALRRQLFSAGLLSEFEKLGQRSIEFAHLTFQEYYLAKSLNQRNEFSAALREHWWDRRYDETLALAASLLIEAGEERLVEQEIAVLVERGRQTFDQHPDALYEIGRSPLRAALELLRRSGIKLARLPELSKLLERVVCLSSARRLAVVQGRVLPPDLIAAVAAGAERSVRIQIAQDDQTPEAVLEKLATDEDADVRRLVASNVNVPVKLLSEFASAVDRSQRWAAGQHPHASTSIIWKVARDRDYGVRAGTIKHPNASGELLGMLAKDSRQFVREKVAECPTAPKKVLWDLSRDENSEVRKAVAANQAAPSQVLSRLAADPEAFVRWNVATNPATRESVLVALARDHSDHVRRFLAENPRLPDAVLQRLAQDEHPEVRGRVALNPSLPRHLLATLARDSSVHTRRIVAFSRSASPDLLMQLGRDAFGKVREAVAGNPNAPEEILIELARDNRQDPPRGERARRREKRWFVIRLVSGHGDDDRIDIPEAVARNPSAPASVLSELARHRKYRSAVAHNPSASPELLSDLANDEDWVVRYHVAENASTLEATLAYLATDRGEWVRWYVARNPQAPPECLVKLARDSHPEIRELAARNPRTLLECL